VLDAEVLEVVRETDSDVDVEGRLASSEVELIETGNGAGNVRLDCEKTVATVEMKADVRGILILKMRRYDRSLGKNC